MIYMLLMKYWIYIYLVKLNFPFSILSSTAMVPIVLFCCCHDDNILNVCMMLGNQRLNIYAYVSPYIQYVHNKECYTKNSLGSLFVSPPLYPFVSLVTMVSLSSCFHLNDDPFVNIAQWSNPTLISFK